MPSKHQWMLAVIATDRTFERAVRGGVACWVGKCIHCGGKLVLGADGTPISAATLEHIWPRTHGGLTELANLALACARCNRGKGVRHDVKHARDPRLLEIVAALRARRAERWRDPAEVGLADLVARLAPAAATDDDDEA